MVIMLSHWLNASLLLSNNDDDAPDDERDVDDDGFYFDPEPMCAGNYNQPAKRQSWHKCGLICRRSVRRRCGLQSN